MMSFLLKFSFGKFTFSILDALCTINVLVALYVCCIRKNS